MLITELKSTETLRGLLKGKVFVLNCHGCREIRFPEHEADAFQADLTAEASAQGLSTCILGWFDDEKVRTLCGLKYPVRLIITLGYAAEGDKLRPKKRKELTELVSWKE